MQAQSVGNTIKYDGVTYTFTSVASGNRTVKITGVDNTVTGEVTFPSSILDAEGNASYNVTAVDCLFGNNDISILKFPEGIVSATNLRGNNIKVLEIPSTLTSIAAGTNHGMQLPALTAINVAEGNPSFSSDNGVLFNHDGTALEWYPDGRTEQSYRVPDGVESINRYGAFFNPALTEIILPNTLKEIGNTAIIADNLVTIDIPKSVTSLSPISSKSLQKYNVDSENPVYSDIDGVLCNKEKTTLLHFPAAYPQKDYVVPSSITTIGASSFANSWQCMVTSVDFRQSQVTTIENSAFRTCSRLKQVFFNDELKTVGTEAFRYTGLTSVEFPESLTIIGNNSFANSKISSVYIPASLVNIGDGALSGNPITAYEVSEENPNYWSDENGVVFSKEENPTLLFYPRARSATRYEIPEGTIHIAEGALQGASYLEEVNIPSSLQTIGKQSFYQCTSLKEITYSSPTQLKSIDIQAFGACRGLTAFEVPSSVESIGSQAFIQCNGLVSFKISDNSLLGSVTSNLLNLTSVKEFTVGKNTKVQNISSGALPATLEKLTIEEGNPQLTKLSGLKNFTSLREVNIAADCGLKTIDNETFWGCTGLERLVLPQTVETLGVNAFYNTPNLKEIVFAEPSQLKRIGENAFQECGILSMNLPASVERIDRQAFHGCFALSEVNLGANASSVDPEAFYLCSQLKAINVDKENTVYSSADGCLCNKEKTELMIFPAGKASEKFTLLPPSLTKIGRQAFFACSNLQKVMVPKKVTAIDESAFWLCDNLKDIVLLGDAPLSAELIGEKAFPTDIATTAKLWVRHGTTAAYQAADFWKEFTDMEEAKLTEDGAYEFFAMDDTRANLLSIQKDDETLIIPETVEADGNSYTVDLIGDYAFEDCNAAINEVVVNHPVSYVGARAFVNGTRPAQIQNVFFVGTTPATEVATAKFDIAQAYAEVNANQHLYVKKSALETYQTAWPQLREQLSYQIPLSMGSEYGTFCREFDTDFSELNASTTHEDWPNVIAFTAGKYAKGTDEEGNPCYYVRMKSINLGAEEGDGTYIPANTAVLLRTMDGAASTNYFFYQIHEDDLEDYSADNLMCGVTVKAREIQPTEGEYTNFLVSGGMLHKMTVPRTFPVHKAYMRIPTADLEAAGGKVVMLFEETDAEEDMEDDLPASNEPTGAEDGTSADTEEPAAIVDGINGLTTDEVPVIYNINGQRINRSLQALSKGVYIVNGKKTIVK